jgi:hypothetical protein
MKRLIVAAIFMSCLIALPPIPGQTTSTQNSNANSKNADATKTIAKPPALVPEKANPLHAGEAGHNGSQASEQNNIPAVKIKDPVTVKSDKSGWDIAAVVATFLLVGVGVWGVLVATITLKEIARQATETARAAKATEDNTAHTVKKERAIIQVEAMNIPASPACNLPPPPYDVVAYKVFNRGLTAAKIMYAYAIVDISETHQSCSGEYSTFSNGSFGLNLGSFFSPTSDGVTRYAVSEVRFDWDVINGRKKYVHFWGKVNYRDLFSEEDRETGFHYVWWIDSQRLADGSTFGQWLERGGEKENYQT